MTITLGKFVDESIENCFLTMIYLLSKMFVLSSYVLIINLINVSDDNFYHVLGEINYKLKSLFKIRFQFISAKLRF